VGYWRRLNNLYAYTKYYSGEQIKEDEIGGVCSTHGRDKKRIHYFCWKT
jgi:hypothetical protein